MKQQARNWLEALKYRVCRSEWQRLHGEGVREMFEALLEAVKMKSASTARTDRPEREYCNVC